MAKKPTSAEPAKSSMTAKQFGRALGQVGLSVYASAPFFGISLSTAQRFSAGKYPVPEAIAKLLRLMVAYGLKHQDVQ